MLVGLNGLKEMPHYVLKVVLVLFAGVVLVCYE